MAQTSKKNQKKKNRGGPARGFKARPKDNGPSMALVKFIAQQIETIPPGASIIVDHEKLQVLVFEPKGFREMAGYQACRAVMKASAKGFPERGICAELAGKCTFKQAQPGVRSYVITRAYITHPSGLPAAQPKQAEKIPTHVGEQILAELKLMKAAIATIAKAVGIKKTSPKGDTVGGHDKG